VGLVHLMASTHAPSAAHAGPPAGQILSPGLRSSPPVPLGCCCPLERLGYRDAERSGRPPHRSRTIPTPLRLARWRTSRRGPRPSEQFVAGTPTSWCLRVSRLHARGGSTSRLRRAAAHLPARGRLRPGRLRRGGQLVAGSGRPAHVWPMRSRSLQRLPPRSPLRSPGRSTPSLARRLAGRAGWRHGHPLPTMRGDQAGHTAEIGAVCQVPEDTMTEKIRAAASSSPHTRRSQRRPGRRRGARSSR
jgi:hypothetical protein